MQLVGCCVGLAWGAQMESLLSLGPRSAEVCFGIVCWGLEKCVTVPRLGAGKGHPKGGGGSQERIRPSLPKLHVTFLRRIGIGKKIGSTSDPNQIQIRSKSDPNQNEIGSQSDQNQIEIGSKLDRHQIENQVEIGSKSDQNRIEIGERSHVKFVSGPKLFGLSLGTCLVSCPPPPSSSWSLAS